MIQATKFLRKWPTATAPFLVECSDGTQRVIRQTHPGLSGSIASQWTFDYLGHAMGAPVLRPEIVHLAPEFVAAVPELADFASGPAHGQEFLGDDVADVNLWPADFEALCARGHRQGFAYLAVLLGWFSSAFVRTAGSLPGDPLQVQTAGDRMVSIDHHDVLTTSCHKRNANGSRGAEWCPVEVSRQSTRGELHPGFAPALLQRSDLEPAIQGLERITRATIVDAIASMPDPWMPAAPRLPMVEWLNARRRSLISDFRMLPLAAVG